MLYFANMALTRSSWIFAFSAGVAADLGLRATRAGSVLAMLFGGAEAVAATTAGASSDLGGADVVAGGLILSISGFWAGKEELTQMKQQR